MLTPLGTPLPVSTYPLLATVLLMLGLLSTGSFFLYEVSKTRHSRQIHVEFLIAAVASVFLGLGTLFLLLWTGVYV